MVARFTHISIAACACCTCANGLFDSKTRCCRGKTNALTPTRSGCAYVGAWRGPLRGSGRRTRLRRSQRPAVESCLTELKSLGTLRSHIDVFKPIALASTYWESQGSKLQTDIHRYSLVQAAKMPGSSFKWICFRRFAQIKCQTANQCPPQWSPFTPK